MLFLVFYVLNDIESVFYGKGLQGIDIDSFKIFLISYADDIMVLFANSNTELQNCLDILSEYCKRWKLDVNTVKTKVWCFKKMEGYLKTVLFIIIYQLKL